MNPTQDHSGASRPGARRWLALDKLGAFGAILSAIAAPCCFPLFAAAAGWLGLGSIPVLRSNSSLLIQVMTALALLGQVAAYHQHRRSGPLLVSVVSTGLIAGAYHVRYHVTLVYVALAGLGIAAVWNYLKSRTPQGCCAEVQTKVVLESVLTCPRCGRQSREQMPTDACVYFYDCTGCGTRLKPKPGDCCVFCSYGTVKCPPIQLGRCCELTPRATV